MEKTRGWWLQRAISALTKFCEADEAVQQAKAMVQEHGWCAEHPDIKLYLEREPDDPDCGHCERTWELLVDKQRALADRAGKKATLLRVAKRAGISAREPVPRREPLARRATLEA